MMKFGMPVHGKGLELCVGPCCCLNPHSAHGFSSRVGVGDKEQQAK